MWQFAIPAIMGGIQGALSGAATRYQIKAANILGKAKADASNRVRTANNELEAASSSLSRWVQSVNNNRTLKAGGESLEALTVNVLRQRDAEARASFSSRIRDAEQQGGAMAAQAAAGVAGATTDMVNGSTALRMSIMREQEGQYQDFAAYDSARKGAAIFSQMMGGLDNSLIFAALDYGKDVYTEQQAPSIGQSFLQGALKGLASSPTAMSSLSSGAGSLIDSAKGAWSSMMTPNYMASGGFSSAPSGLASFSFAPQPGFNIGAPVDMGYSLEGISFGS